MPHWLRHGQKGALEYSGAALGELLPPDRAFGIDDVTDRIDGVTDRRLVASPSGRHCYVLDVSLGRVADVIGRKRLWKLQSMITAILGAMIAKKLIRGAFRVVRKDKAPAAVFDPTSAGFSWPDVVVWAAAAGVGLGVAKVVSARVAAIGWKVATGTLPPGVEKQAVG